MKTVGTLISIWLLLGLSTPFAQDQELYKEASNRYVASSTYTFMSEAPGQLVMENLRGDITISGVPTYQIEIVEEITIRSNSEGQARDLLNDAKASVQQTSSDDEPLVIRVTGQHTRRRYVSFDYSVKVPTLFSALVQTRGGNLNIEHIKGQIDVTTAGGDIDLLDLNGKISATTSGGDVEVLNLGGRVNLNTSGGDIEVDEIKGELFANTAGGDIDVQEVEGSVSVNTSGGDIDLADIKGREVIARTSGGDVTAYNLSSIVDLSTTGGDIQMEQINGNTEASTSGGEIDMDEIHGDVKVWTAAGSITGENIAGSLNARTSAGDIIISKVWDRNLENHDLDLKTSAGDIEITLPRDFSANFAVRTVSPGGKSGESIVSDFPLDISASRAVARAKGTIGDGQFDVKLETSIGVITIYTED